ncbi:DUF7661 family protein [Pseudoduganella armeniaca]|uniref:DUF7661 domain-containing protein n=1 Tax=Pseudoduganella armeniaca TaxID=2072590 RepID=A0A2R4CAH6_9BURK|nr:hypothetical protein [Pseudoduganella armeniaca]AVR96595.1 hypothetical protein C9I28_13495 [Pseudoduganella armeniaca]
MPIRFNVFGTRIDIERRGNAWLAWHPGSDGKRRPADLVVPPDLDEEELGRYLGDLLHEDARPGHDEVVRL